MSDSSPNAPASRPDLEQEKLRLEVDQLRNSSSKKPYDYIPLISAAVAVLGFLWGIVQYSSQAERELMRPWLEDQRNTYVEALKAAEIIASGEEGKLRTRAIKDFDALYDGRMILVETKAVCDAMIDFRSAFRAEAPSDILSARCRQLASTMAESMAMSSKLSYAEFNNAKYIYTRDKRRALERQLDDAAGNMPKGLSLPPGGGKSLGRAGAEETQH